MRHPALIAAAITLATLLILVFGRHLGGPVAHLPHPTTTSPPGLGRRAPSSPTTTALAPGPNTSASPSGPVRPSGDAGSVDAVPSPSGASAASAAIGRDVTAIGDSVMLDYAADLERDLPGCTVIAKVGQQWTEGVALARQLAATGRLGSVVVVALGTNGPITSGDVAAMLQALSGARRVVLVTDHVDRPWQGPNNAELQSAARGHPDVVLADWNRLAEEHPGWFYADGTHLPEGGPGATALAALVAAAVEGAST